MLHMLFIQLWQMHKSTRKCPAGQTFSICIQIFGGDVHNNEKVYVGIKCIHTYICMYSTVHMHMYVRVWYYAPSFFESWKARTRGTTTRTTTTITKRTTFLARVWRDIDDNLIDFQTYLAHVWEYCMFSINANIRSSYGNGVGTLHDRHIDVYVMSTLRGYS